MLFKKQIFAACFLLLCSHLCNAQIEVDYAHGKDYNSIGFGGFLNFSFPAGESDYLTVEGGVQYFKSSDDEELALIPVLAGYRYTLDRTGSGLYVEPFAGYAFGGSTIGSYNENGGWEGGNVKVAGPAAGLGVGYLFDIGNIPFNVGLRLQHNFGNYGTSTLGLRISHSFGFRKRDDY
jgi:hypothetical protein